MTCHRCDELERLLRELTASLSWSPGLLSKGTDLTEYQAACLAESRAYLNAPKAEQDGGSP